MPPAHRHHRHGLGPELELSLHQVDVERDEDWLAEPIYIPTAAIIDMATRQVAGWAMWVTLHAEIAVEELKIGSRTTSACSTRPSRVSTP